MAQATLDLSGARYGRLVVQDTAPPMYSQAGTRWSAWWCRCDCGRMLAVRHDKLVRPTNATRSCGCGEGHVPDQTMSLARCIRAVGLTEQGFKDRLARGWTLTEALTIPKGQRRP